MKALVSIAQTHIELAQPEVNMAKAIQWIETAAHQGSQLILFPELWTTGYDLPHRSQLAQQNQAIIREMKALAQKHKIWIGGSYIQEKNNEYFNSLVLLSPNSSQSVTYQKIHLFPLLDEPVWFKAGDAPQITHFPWGTAGLSICYDLRFPELYRKYALSGCDVLLVCAEWPIERISNWQVLLRARAIENQAYVIAVNATGETGENHFGGKSAIISPTGDMIAEAKEDEILIHVEIDLDLVSDIRSKIPALSNRRPDVY
jgi:omega-amidase